MQNYLTPNFSFAPMIPERALDDVGLDALGEAHPAFLVRPRLVDVGAAVNRLRSLQVNPG